MNIIGIHIGHDSGAALIADGVVKAAVDEERYTRNKHCGDPPVNAINYCMDSANGKIDMIAVSSDLLGSEMFKFFELNTSKFLSSKYIGRPKIAGPRSLLQIGKRVREGMNQLPSYIRTAHKFEDLPLVSVGHHLCHAAAAYYTSGFPDKTLVITMDGLGDNDSVTVWLSEKGKLQQIHREGREGSIGWFYSMVTEALGWWIGDGEGKTMGLAPYGDPAKVPSEILTKYMPRYENGVLVEPYGFGKTSQYKYATSYHWHFKDTAEVEKEVEKYGNENIAALAQKLLEEHVVEFVRHWKEKTGAKRLATGGGIFLNVKVNQKIVEGNLFDDYFIFPCPADNGLAVGAALTAYYDSVAYEPGKMIRDVYWGPEYSDDHIESILVERNLSFRKIDDPCTEGAKFLADGKIVGWFQGRMEHGPRALGGRSILMSATRAENKDIINARVKFREPFRPFCPSLKAESATNYFYVDRPERYMITAYGVKQEVADQIPAVVHVDGTCRPQIVEKDIYPRFWKLLDEFEKLSGVPVLLNTSFNIKGEPIVCSPRDALKCFFDTGLDVLIMGNYLLEK